MKKTIKIVSTLVILLWALTSTAYPASKFLLLKNANIITISGDTIQGGDILIKNGKIFSVGKNHKPLPNYEVKDLTGKWIMPGIIDSHSHIALEGAVNEMGDLMTPEVDVLDIINPEDINIFYALTGGVTSIHTMHGSGNPIGGRGVVLKLRWGAKAKDLIFKGAPLTIKWALGENPKRSNMAIGPARYPRTRMGVEASIRKEFTRARDYVKDWDYYLKQSKIKKNNRLLLPPKRDYRAEVVADILRGKYWIRCHAYQSEEMLSILKLCKEFKVKLVCFEHGLEGYRITNELVKYKVAVSTFADFWGYKWEAYNTMPHSAALMAKRGVLVAVNSDDAERMRRLNHDAAKLVRFGGLSELEALKTITIHPAVIMGIDKQTGTIEAGKDADLAVYSRHPFDPYTICEMTLVDGKVYFDRKHYLEERQKKTEKQKKPQTSQKKKGEVKS